MPWSTPKTDWVPADGVSAADMNRIEDNTAMLRNASGISVQNAGNYIGSSNVEDALQELGVDLITGKSQAASALTAMNQPTNANELLSNMARKIRDISKDANATAAQILSGRTAYVGGVKVTGTMTNRAGTVQRLGWSNGNADTVVDINPTAGYYDGYSQIQIEDPDLTPDKIKSGVNIFGVQGTFTNDAVLDPQYLVQGYSGYDDGVKKNGTMVNRSSEAYHNPAQEYTVWQNDRVFLRPKRGFYDGSSWVTAPAPQFNAGNIASGVNILGIVGNLPVRLFANGEVPKKPRDPGGWWEFRVDLGWIPTIFVCYVSTTDSYSLRIASLTALSPGSLPSWWQDQLWRMEIQSTYSAQCECFVPTNTQSVIWRTNDIGSTEQAGAQWFAFRVLR